MLAIINCMLLPEIVQPYSFFFYFILNYGLLLRVCDDAHPHNVRGPTDTSGLRTRDVTRNFNRDRNAKISKNNMSAPILTD